VEALIYCLAQAVTYREAELVVPDLHVPVDKFLCEWSDKRALVLASVADEHVVEHAVAL
jgi:hypothetical protein